VALIIIIITKYTGANGYKQLCTILFVRYRSRDQIIGSILQSAAANEGITKTKMMYSSFLSYSQLLDYLSFMLSNELLEYNSAERTYKHAAKGSEFLELNNRIANLLNKPNDLLVPPVKYHLR
jgi:predicted transcriptional regulator